MFKKENVQTSIIKQNGIYLLTIIMAIFFSKYMLAYKYWKTVVEETQVSRQVVRRIRRAEIVVSVLHITAVNVALRVGILTNGV